MVTESSSGRMVASTMVSGSKESSTVSAYTKMRRERTEEESGKTVKEHAG